MSNKFLEDWLDRGNKRCMPYWGLVQWVAYSCRRFRVDKLLIEAKATGITCSQELRRLYKDEDWARSSW